MSVVVRMEMPKDCLDCPCVNHEYGYCQADEEVRQIGDPDGRPSWRPIICAIPEGHGDLIDRDKTFHAAQPMGCTDEQWAETTLGRVVMEAWAIVPAERSET